YGVGDVPLGGRGGGGRGAEHIEEDGGLVERERGGGDVVSGERGKVGRLLLVGAPQADRGGDRAGGERGDRQPHVAAGERLRDERPGHRRALLGDAAEGLR